MNNPWASFNIFIFLLSTICYIPATNGGYVVTTPRRWTSGESSQLCVVLTDPATSGDTLSIGVKSEDAEPVVLVEKKEFLLPEGERSVCNAVFLPPSIKEKANIHISGLIGAAKLNISKPISISRDVAQTYVQTDKFLYKPSQNVQFRILTVTGPFLKLSLEKYDEIWIENPSGTRITQWLDVPNADGLIHLSFQLSSEPEEGEYKIRVRTPYGKTVDQAFKVEDYVLPRYEVTIKPPKYILGTTEQFTFKICAQYTFGQPVKGNFTFSLSNNGWGTYVVEVKKQDKLSGCKKVHFNSSEINLNGKDYFTYSVSASAVVVEEGTGVELVAEKVNVDVTRTALTFKDVSVQKFFKPELPFVGEIKIELPDKSPAANELMEVCAGEYCKNLTTNINGLLKFVLPPHIKPVILIKSINYPELKLKDSWRSIMSGSRFNKNLKEYHSPSNSSLVIALAEGDLECVPGKTIDFDLPVRFSAVEQPSAFVTVQVISRGQIQFSATSQQALNVPNELHLEEALFVEALKEPVTKNATRGHFTVPVSLPSTVSPEAKILVWYSRDDGEVVSDTRTVDITECLLNSVALKWSVEKAQPGDPSSLSLQAEPQSLCSLGVVDKSVQLLSSKENSLTIKKLLKVAERASVKDYELSQVNDYEYCKGKDEGTTSDARKPVEENPVNTKEKRSLIPLRRPSYSKNVDALHMFDEAGVYSLSDLTLETRTCKPNRYDIQIQHLLADFDSTDRRVFATSVTNIRPEAAPAFVFNEIDSPNGKDTSSSTKRTYFPETWLWKLYAVPETGSINETVTLPDTVTEWVGSAVCVHPSKGVGVSAPSSITTFKDFFTDLTLPAAVKRGEIFPVKISVFNYLEESLPVKIHLEDSPSYDILSDEGNDIATGERSSCIPSQDKTVHAIRVRMKEIGDVNLTVTATVDTNSLDTCGFGTGKVRTDVLIKPIRVEIEGFVKDTSWSKYVCANELANGEDNLEPWNIVTPPSIIENSGRAFVAVVGDLMGPTLENLGSLVKMPYGCGEQNMLNFAPNIFVMQYLDASKQNNEETAQNAIEYMKKGYQRELNYRHSDGSYSAFGESDGSGSTWLTAFVLKSFAQARSYIAIDQDDLNMSKDWLKRKQLENGCFESVGKVLHKGMKGGITGSESPSLLSSFVLISLLEAGEDAGSKAVREALFCINAEEMITNPYQQAVKAYALALASSPDTKQAIDHLLSLATNDSSTTHWKQPKEFESGKGVGVETAGYAVLSLLTFDAQTEASYKEQARKIIKWMNNQRNGQGGFVSTQDTIVALQSMAEYEKKIPQGPVDLAVLVGIDGLETDFTINEKNKLLQQRTDIPALPASVNFGVDGEGCVLLQAVLRYNVPEPDASEAFSIRVETATEPDAGCKTKRVTACSSYKLEDLKSNMAIIEVNLVSGYIPEKADLKKVVGYKTGLFKRYEVDGSTVTFYVDEFSSEEICVTFRVIREVDVENPKAGFVKVYDYYKPEYFVSETYNLPPNEECRDVNVEGLGFEEEIIPNAGDIATTTTSASGGAEEKDLGALIDAFDEAIS